MLSRAALEVFQPAGPPHPIRSAFAWGLLGVAVGAMTVAIFPHPLFHGSRFHGVSLIISPILAGVVMSTIGAALRRRGKRVVQIESFPYAFAFAFGMALVRLVRAL